jgi:hypothetical protein
MVSDDILSHAMNFMLHRDLNLHIYFRVATTAASCVDEPQQEWKVGKPG